MTHVLRTLAEGLAFFFEFSLLVGVLAYVMTGIAVAVLSGHDPFERGADWTGQHG